MVKLPGCSSHPVHRSYRGTHSLAKASASLTFIGLHMWLELDFRPISCSRPLISLRISQSPQVSISVIHVVMLLHLQHSCSRSGSWPALNLLSFLQLQSVPLQYLCFRSILVVLVIQRIRDQLLRLLSYNLCFGAKRES